MARAPTEELLVLEVMTTVEVTDDEEEAEAAAATPPPTAGLPACVQPAALEGLSLEDLAEVTRAAHTPPPPM